MKAKIAFGVSVGVLILSVVLAIAFHIVQGTHQGCWSGSEFTSTNTNGTNIVYDNGYVLCCNGEPLASCLLSIQ